VPVDQDDLHGGLAKFLYEGDPGKSSSNYDNSRQIGGGNVHERELFHKGTTYLVPGHFFCAFL
jgi:hypothetical protein